MTDAFIIENAGETAGIVVREDNGLRFYASTPGYFVLDGETYGSVSAAQRAVYKLQREWRGTTTPANQFRPAA